MSGPETASKPGRINPPGRSAPRAQAGKANGPAPSAPALSKRRRETSKSDMGLATPLALVIYTPMEYCKIPRRVLWQTEARSVSATDGSSIVNRLRRLEGQVRGVAQMIEDARYCIDVLNQAQTLKAALGPAACQIPQPHSPSRLAQA